jgi:hypothetical protein
LRLNCSFISGRRHQSQPASQRMRGHNAASTVDGLLHQCRGSEKPIRKVKTDCNRLQAQLLRIVGASTAPTCLALACRWRSRPHSIKSGHYSHTFVALGRVVEPAQDQHPTADPVRKCPSPLECCVRVRFEPQSACRAGWIESEPIPPPSFFAVTMEFTMMSPA